MLALVAGPQAARAGEAEEPAFVRSLTHVIHQIKSRYVDELDDRALFRAAIRGMIGELDPHSAFLDVEDYRALQQETSGRFGGLGLEVGKVGGYVRVLGVHRNSPAFRSGIRPGDLIARLDDTDVSGLTLDQAIQRARGAPDTAVKVTLLREGDTNPREMSLIRATLHPPSVTAQFVDPAVAYLRIAQFTESSAEEVVSGLNDMLAGMDVMPEGLVLDLRDNPGGLLRTAVDVASLFLPQDSLIVRTEGVARGSRRALHTNASETNRASPSASAAMPLPSYVRSLPMVVLINGGSASAAEIVAGALQDHERAAIVGTQSFGKGSVQVVIPLGDGTAIKLTTARYFTPSGRSLQSTGIAPDVVVPDEPRIGDGHDVELTPIDNASGATGPTLRADPQLDEALRRLRIRAAAS